MPSARALAGVLVLLAGALCGCRERRKGEDHSTEVAVVHGIIISTDQFASELAFAKRTSAGVLPQTDDEVVAFRRAALEDLIDRMLVLNAAHESGIDVSPDNVEREVLRLKAEYHGKGFNEALSEGQLSQQELRERTRSRLLYERYFVDEVFARVAVTDSEIEAYYKEHETDFHQPELVHAAQIIVKSAEEARRILGKIHEGMSFDDAARRWSLSPDAKVGGDLGSFKRGVMPPVFDQTCFALGSGKVSEVVASDYGYHLFKVLDRRPAEVRSLARARGDIERILLQKKREEAQKRALLELRAGRDAAPPCRMAGADGGAADEQALLTCLKKAASERIKINEAVLAQVQL